jgi:hypothetical protein
MTEDQIKHMVDRFLGWRLPENFNPDCGISFKRDFNEHTARPMKHEPTGTNLFDATQATAMVRHMLDGLPAPPVDPTGDAQGLGERLGHWPLHKDGADFSVLSIQAQMREAAALRTKDARIAELEAGLRRLANLSPGDAQDATTGGIINHVRTVARQALSSSPPPVEAGVPSEPKLPPGGLTSQEKFLLEWLSKEDSSAYGECEGQALTVLINCGLAMVTPEVPRTGYSRVSLTDAGRQALFNPSSDGGGRG